MTFPHLGLVLAGFTLACAVWRVSTFDDLSTYAPFIIVEHQEGRTIHGCPGYSADSLRAFAEKNIESDTSVNGWAAARVDSAQGDDGKMAYAITVEFWARGMERDGALIQIFAPVSKHERFQLLADPMVGSKEGVLDSASTAPLLLEVDEGIRLHPRAASLWPTWRS